MTTMRQRMMEDLQIRNYAPRYGQGLHPWSCQLRQAFRQVTGPARRRADSGVSTISDQREGSGAAHLYPDH